MYSVLVGYLVWKETFGELLQLVPQRINQRAKEGDYMSKLGSTGVLTRL